MTEGCWPLFSSVAALCSPSHAWPLFLFLRAVPDGVASPFPPSGSRSPSSTGGQCSHPPSSPSASSTSLGHPLQGRPGPWAWGINTRAILQSIPGPPSASPALCYGHFFPCSNSGRVYWGWPKPRQRWWGCPGCLSPRSMGTQTWWRTGQLSRLARLGTGSGFQKESQ